MLFGLKPFKKLLNEDESYWKDIDSLVNYVEESDMSIRIPVRLIEHQIIEKVWYELA